MPLICHGINKAICCAIFVNEIWAESMISQPTFYFVNRSKSKNKRIIRLFL